MTSFYIALGIIFGILVCIVYARVCINFAIVKRKNTFFAGFFGLMFGLLAVLYYWSLPDPAKLHEMYPGSFDEFGNKINEG